MAMKEKKIINKLNKRVLNILINKVDNNPLLINFLNKSEKINRVYISYRPKIRKFLGFKKVSVGCEILFEDLDEGGKAAYMVLLKKK